MYDASSANRARGLQAIPDTLSDPLESVWQQKFLAERVHHNRTLRRLHLTAAALVIVGAMWLYQLLSRIV